MDKLTRERYPDLSERDLFYERFSVPFEARPRSKDVGDVDEILGIPSSHHEIEELPDGYDDSIRGSW